MERDSSGNCVGSHLNGGSPKKLLFDNSASGPESFPPGLVPNYINTEGWNDPLNPNSNGDPFTCRYIIPAEGYDPGSVGCEEANSNCLTECKPQKYFMHCKVENVNFASVNDGGAGVLSDELIEVFSDPWLCVDNEPG